MTDTWEWAKKKIFNQGRLPFEAKQQSNARGEKILKKLILASMLFWTLPANALTITNDLGGLIPMYVAKMQRAAAMGEQVIIDGNCLSACTMTLGIIPPQNVCATPRAVLGFHSAFTPTPWGQKLNYPPGTVEMVSHYPPSIRAWIKRHGGLHPRMIYMRAPEIFQYVRPCQSGPNPGW
jgi:hypothetical protein